MDTSKKHDKPNPRLTANPFNKLIFWWLKPLFMYGKNHDLEIKDIYNVLPDDISKLLGDKLEQNWNKELQTAREDGRKPKLFTALRKTFIWSFAFYGGWALFLSCFLRVLQPYTLGLLIWHFDPRATSSPAEAYAYASGVVIMALLIALISHHAFLGQMEIGMRMRIACSSLLYRKILKLSRAATNTTTAGQIINLLSNDVARFEQLFVFLHYIWIMPIQGALIAFLIWESVGIASLAGIFLITIQTIPVQGYVGKLSGKLRLKTAVRTDERVRIMSEIIDGIQVIKMYTWEKPFQELVSLARRHEVAILTLSSYLRGFTLATFVFTERTTLFFTVMAFVLLGNNISADKVFSMAQYYNILQATMAIFYPLAVASASEASVSIKRLENFLLLEENIPKVHMLNTSDKTSIMIKNVTASWSESTITNTLHDINVNIEPGKLCALVGPVGAGKSSFLQLILGELQPSRGQVHIGGTIAYTSQEAWLFAGNIRSNILFGQPYDQNKYQEVVKVCGLLKDFEQLPFGDKTLVGDRGTSLSGGQRARINLARTVYKAADIYLFDDPLSAVDTHVGRHLFDDCINGYLKNKTRILVTHQIQHAKNCDYIILLNNGRIENQGTFADLQHKHVDFLKNLSLNEAKEDSPVSEIDGNLAIGALANSNSTEDENEEEPHETEELMAKGNLPKSIYWSYFRAGGSIIMLLIFFCSTIFGQLGSSGSDYWVAYWTRQEEIRLKAERDFVQNFTRSLQMNLTETNSSQFIETTTMHFSEMLNTAEDIWNVSLDDISNISSENNTRKLFNAGFDNTSYLDRDTALWIYGAFIIASVVLTSTRNLTFCKICMNASINLHDLMFSCLLKAPMLFFETHPSGRILNRFSKDVGAVDELLPKAMIESIQIFAVMTGILAQVIIINWWTIFPMLVMGFLYWKVRNIYLATAQNIKRLEGTTKSPVFSHVHSSILGLTTIRSCNAQDMVIKEFDVHQDQHTGAYSLSIATATAFGLGLDIISVGFVAFITYSFIILDNDDVFAGNVGLAISQVLILCGMLQYGMRQTAETVAQMTSVERILQFTQLGSEGAFESEPNNKPPSQWPMKGEIKFDHVYMRYSDSEPPVLKDLNIIIKSSMKVGIVGRTGAGKSSLISAIFNLAKLDGTIYIDDIDIKKIGLHDLRNKISIIPQEPILFSATLRDNLDPFHKFNDAALWSVLEDVELKEAVSSLDQRVVQGGSNFSAGQRQLLCLARAILRDNKILVLDEATANVDPTTDSLIQNTIRKKFKTCTVLTIAHRLNTIMDSDKVLVMDHGEAVEFDHPYILLQNVEGHFSKLVRETGKMMMEQLKEVSKKAYDEQQSAITSETSVQNTKHHNLENKHNT